MPLRVFVLGATGYLGGAIATRLARDGHEVRGLARREEPARGLADRGIQPVVGTLDDPAPWISRLQNCDAVVHAAAAHEDGRLGDARALEVVRAGATDGRVRRLLYTSGVWDHGSHPDPFDESAPFDPLPGREWRIAHHDVAFDLAVHDVEVTVMQPGIVYGGSRGLLGTLFAAAHETGAVPVPGDGSQRWPLLHRDDLAAAYALALERGPGGGRLLLADGSAHRALEVVAAIGAVTGARVERHEARDAALTARLGPGVLRDQVVHAARARRTLGWEPRHTSFVAAAAGLYREWQAGRPSPIA